MDFKIKFNFIFNKNDNILHFHIELILILLKKRLEYVIYINNYYSKGKFFIFD